MGATIAIGGLIAFMVVHRMADSAGVSIFSALFLLGLTAFVGSSLLGV